MITSSQIPDVGSQTPDLKNSPIASEYADEWDIGHQDVEGQACCYYNGKDFENGRYVRCGTSLLICDDGIWVSAGSSDLDNP